MSFDSGLIGCGSGRITMERECLDARVQMNNEKKRIHIVYCTQDQILTHIVGMPGRNASTT
jgi:hypothetical protein